MCVARRATPLTTQKLVKCFIGFHHLFSFIGVKNPRLLIIKLFIYFFVCVFFLLYEQYYQFEEPIGILLECQVLKAYLDLCWTVVDTQIIILIRAPSISTPEKFLLSSVLSLGVCILVFALQSWAAFPSQPRRMGVCLHIVSWRRWPFVQLVLFAHTRNQEFSHLWVASFDIHPLQKLLWRSCVGVIKFGLIYEI